ncbi:nucleoid-associated protein [Clostridium cellulovorans]|uniref:37kDa nucleoid-associated protein n=1 Tax=Clostridium cellulovorans (strain ATCC 35296 / DSM 3052 / OCM 3 / 743B) TaxID=573061 RepID=D9SUB4_CLOC7|nr:nucleoid-associated protein [Clostridium cellulovorans]ADL52869.1 hypothetical protein Clocel_3183 [Clostridium cellulovorans 743B]
MEYINDISINKGIIHILDTSIEEPILTEFPLALGEEVQEYLLKHLKKSLRDEELKYGVFNEGENILKTIIDNYRYSTIDFISMSKAIAQNLFAVMKDNCAGPCDVLIVDFLTEYGHIVGILKLDYIKNYAHSVDIVDEKVGIKIIEQYSGLPGGGQKLQKCAFIKVTENDNAHRLMVLDKKVKNPEGEEETYFVEKFLQCDFFQNERDMTKSFIQSAEKWTQENLKESADDAEAFRRTIRRKLQEDDEIKIPNLVEEFFKDSMESKASFSQYMEKAGLQETVALDKEYLEKKLKRARLKIDKDIDIYINQDAYNDPLRFEIKRNGDGTINMVIKNISNYIEK